MAEQNLFCLCGRCSRKLRSAAARRVGMGSTCCRKETGKTITQLLKELDEQEAAAAAEQQEPDTGKMKIFPSGKTGCSTTINTRRMGRHERKTSKIQPRNLKTI